MLIIFFLLFLKIKLFSSVSSILMAMDFDGVSFNVSLFMSHKILNIYYPKGCDQGPRSFRFFDCNSVGAYLFSNHGHTNIYCDPDALFIEWH